MPRPDSVSNEDILRWNEIIEQDPNMTFDMADSAILLEVCYAGQWLREELIKLKCDNVLIGRIMYTAGGLSFGRDPWDVHQFVLQAYKDGAIEYENEATLSN